jgi:hypothetical protein
LAKEKPFMMNLPESKLTKKQTKVFGPRKIGDNETIKAFVRYDDELGNGHNTFAVTAQIRGRNPQTGRYEIQAGGCLHDEATRVFPELAPFVKWHLVSSDGPLHYIANTTYLAEEGDLKAARSKAVWPDATADQLKNPEILNARLPALMSEFKKDIESLGFTY